MFNKRKGSLLLKTLLLAVFLLGSFPSLVFADDGDDVWSEVIDADGNILYDNLIDQGLQAVDVDWMPSITLFPGLDLDGDILDIHVHTDPIEITPQAEYHVYETPSGNIIQMPDPLTLFFSSLNPVESGIDQASSIAGSLGYAQLSSLGYIESAFTGADVNWTMDPFGGDGYTGSYADALIAGETSAWTTILDFDVWRMFSALQDAGNVDQNLYTAMLLYTPDNIPEDLADLLPEDEPDDPDDPDDPDEPDTPDHVTCPAPSVAVGKISRSGTLVSPNYPLVVGQDPDKRGVDVSFSVNVAPTIYTYYVEVPVYENGWCGNCNNSATGGTPCHRCQSLVGYECRVQTQVYNETIPVAYGALALTDESRDWIEDTLSIRYPGAYVHKSAFHFPSSGGGSSWSYTQDHIPVQDPGKWNITVGGRTSGTPVSPARNFGGAVNTFDVYLKETAITQ